MSKFNGRYELPNGMVMVLGLNALADLEDITGESAFDVLARMDNGTAKVKDIRNLYFVALKRHQPDVTIEDAGDVFNEYPEALGYALSNALPSDEGNAPKAKPVTGRASRK